MSSPVMLIGAPRFSEGMMRALAMKGDLPRELLAELSASFQIDDLGAAEYQWVRRSALYELGTSLGASPGNFGIVAFLTRAAAQGRTMAVVEQCIIGNSSAATVQVAYGITFSGTSLADPTAVANRRDDRALAITSAYSIISGTAAASPLAGTSHKFATIPAGGSLLDPLPFILTNNESTNRAALIFVTSVVNTPITVSVAWREREVYQEELA